jgi:hypothetical protein
MMTPGEERRAVLETELNNLDPAIRAQVWALLARNQIDVANAVRDGCQKVPERLSVAEARALVDARV